MKSSIFNINRNKCVNVLGLYFKFLVVLLFWLWLVDRYNLRAVTPVLTVKATFSQRPVLKTGQTFNVHSALCLYFIWFIAYVYSLFNTLMRGLE